MAITHFHRLLKERVEEQINNWTIDIARGGAKDHAEYKFMAGQVAGLRACLQICEEIEREADERSNSASSG